MHTDEARSSMSVSVARRSAVRWFAGVALAAPMYFAAAAAGQSNCPDPGCIMITTFPNGPAFRAENYSNTNYSTGFSGFARATSGFVMGIYGASASTGGAGMFGEASATSGVNWGIYGQSMSPSGFGVLGINQAGGVGIRAQSTGTALQVLGGATFSGTAAFNASTPFTVGSTTKVTNLNADLIDGLDSSSFLNTSNDYGRSGVATQLFEGTTALADKYVDGVSAGSGLSGGGNYGVVVLSIANQGVINSHLAANCVTSTKISDSNVTAAKLATSNSASDGKVLTYRVASGLGWEAAGLSLPWAGSASNAGTLFSVSNTGNGIAVNGSAANAGSGVRGSSVSGYGVYAVSTGTGDALYALANSGLAGRFDGNVRVANDLQFGQSDTLHYRGVTGRFGGMSGFNLTGGYSTTAGVVIEGAASESGGFFANGDTATIWSPGDANLLRIYDEDGPTLRAYLDGTGRWYAAGYNTISDIRVKKNITPITGALATVNQLEPIRYDLDEDYFFRGEQAEGKEWNTQALQGQIGFAAQDVKQLVPELVGYDEAQDLYSVNYDGFVPLLVAAVQEQQRQIEQLKSEIEALKTAFRR